jgi:hypothetical protein
LCALHLSVFDQSQNIIFFNRPFELLLKVIGRNQFDILIVGRNAVANGGAKETVMERPPIEKTVGHAACEISKAVISVVPVAGGPLVTLFENIFTTPLNKRRQKWCEERAGVITDIQEKLEGVTPEQLSQNEMFITAALQASQIAIRNHKKEKIEALRNALFNSVMPNAPSEDKQMIYLRLIDDLTPWHLRLLGVLDDPAKWMANNDVRNPGWSMGGVSTVIEHCLPDLRRATDFYDQLTRDL